MNTKNLIKKALALLMIAIVSTGAMFAQIVDQRIIPVGDRNSQAY